MTTFRIGFVEFDFEFLASGVRYGALPLSEQAPANWHLSLMETRDLQAFEAAGWKFRPAEEIAWRAVQRINDGPFEIGVLVRRKPWGGLAIIRDRLIIAVEPGAQWVPAPPDFLDVRPVPLTSSFYDARIPTPDGNLLGTLQERVLSLEGSFGGDVKAEPLLIEHYAGRAYRTSVSVPVQRMDLLQWHWNRIYLEEAWALGSKGAQLSGANLPTRVAVIDFGFDLGEPQLLGQYISYAFVDAAGNISTSSGAMPNDVHGTLCAGLVGAKLDGKSVNGAAPDARLILVAVQSVTTPQLALATAFRLCINGPNGNDGADVLSGSFGTNTSPTTFAQNLQAAVHELATTGRGGRLGTPILWADFNTNDPIPPGSFESSTDLLCVGQSDYGRDERVSCGFGPDLDLIAPGDGVWGLDSSAGKPGLFFGSSVAAPAVAGVAALVLAHRPGLTRDQVMTAVTTSCDPAYRQTTRPDNKHGWGRLNAKNAIDVALTL